MKFIRTFLVIFFLPVAAQACTVCFGGADSNLVKGFTWGILLLLVLPFTMMAGFVGWVARASRKKRIHE